MDKLDFRHKDFEQTGKTVKLIIDKSIRPKIIYKKFSYKTDIKKYSNFNMTISV